MTGADLAEIIPDLLRGAQNTLELTLASSAIALVLALGAGLARLSRSRLIRLSVTAYVELFRGTSLLVQLYFFFYVLPLVGLYIPSFASGILVLALNVGAYGSEVVRGAVLNVDPGQREAATSLNMGRWLTTRRIIMPQAVVMMLPPFGNLLVQLLKATSLVSLITIPDLTFAGKALVQAVGHLNEIYLVVLLIYFVMAYPLASLVGLLESRLAKRLHLGRA